MSWGDTVNRILDATNKVFGETVQYSLNGAAAVAIEGIYDAAHIEIDPETGAPITSSNPIIGFKFDDLPGEPGPNDTVTVRGVAYRVTDKQPDGQGGINLILRRK